MDLHWFQKQLVCFTLFFMCCLFVSIEPKDEKKPPCQVCHDLSDNFMKGLKKTAKSNFGGGNTAWEEKHLGGYAFSETRFIEIQEELCGSSDRECHHMLETNEERLEKWWFKEYRQGTDLKEYFCIKHLKVCCPNGTFGEECKECMGGKDRPCYGNGKCHGEGSREGTGQCECDAGYRSDICDECVSGYFESHKNKTDVTCTKCDRACDSTCWGAGPEGCDDCRKGWDHVDEKGCFDIDECELDTANCSDDKYCSNTDGSFNCVSCDSSCNGCTGAGNTQCKECADSYYLQDETCVACDKSCETCNGAGNSACLKCDIGYERGENDSCVDVNECDSASPICLENQFCTNTEGTHKCSDCHKACKTCHGDTFKNCNECNKGYEMDEEKHCKDINECEAEVSPCLGEMEMCVNMVGSYVCNCESGYEKKNGKCVKTKTKGDKDKKKKKKKKKKVEDKPIEQMTPEEQDAAIQELMDDDSINKRTVNPVKPPVRPKATQDEEKEKVEEEKKSEEKKKSEEAVKEEKEDGGKTKDTVKKDEL